MSTPFASDPDVQAMDCFGFRMLLGVPSVCKAWNAVRVPPRAHHIPSSEGFLL